MRFLYTVYKFISKSPKIYSITSALISFCIPSNVVKWVDKTMQGAVGFGGIDAAA